MGVLFTRLVKNEDKLSNHIKSPVAFTESASSFVTKHYLDTNDDYNQIILESMQSCYIGVKADSPEIIQEGFGDAITNILEWFKKWLVKFKNFIVKCLKKLKDFFTKGYSDADAYLRHQTAFKPFEEEGFDYTIPDDDIPQQLMEEYTNQVFSRAEDILRADPMSRNMVLADAREQTTGEGILDVYRGKMIGENRCVSGKFKDHVDMYFRNNQIEKRKMTIDNRELVKICMRYKEFKKVLASVEKNRHQLEQNCKITMAFIKAEGSFFEYQKMPSSAVGFNDALKKKGVQTSRDQALDIYFNAVNITLRQLHYIFDKYYSRKIDALNEALLFYSKCINKAQARSLASKGGSRLHEQLD